MCFDKKNWTLGTFTAGDCVFPSCSRVKQPSVQVWEINNEVWCHSGCSDILSEISTENQLIIQTANIGVLYYYYLKIAILVKNKLRKWKKKSWFNFKATQNHDSALWSTC